METGYNLNAYVSRYIKLVKNKDEFKEAYASRLHKLNADEVALEKAIDKVFDKYSCNLEDFSFQKYTSKPLRVMGACISGAGTYEFWQDPVSGLGAKFLGLLATSAADLIDGVAHLYKNHETYDLKRLPDLVLETLFEKAMAYNPIAVGELSELSFGRTKFNRRVADKLFYHIKQEVQK